MTDSMAHDGAPRITLAIDDDWILVTDDGVIFLYYPQIQLLVVKHPDGEMQQIPVQFADLESFADVSAGTFCLLPVQGEQLERWLGAIRYYRLGNADAPALVEIVRRRPPAT